MGGPDWNIEGNCERSTIFYWSRKGEGDGKERGGQLPAVYVEPLQGENMIQ